MFKTATNSSPTVVYECYTNRQNRTGSAAIAAATYQIGQGGANKEREIYGLKAQDEAEALAFLWKRVKRMTNEELYTETRDCGLVLGRGSIDEQMLYVRLTLDSSLLQGAFGTCSKRLGCPFGCNSR